MAKRVTMLQDAAAESPEAPGAGPHSESLEQRVQRLEDAVAGLQDTQPLEDRVVERVSERLGLRVPPKPAPASEPEPMPSAARRTAPPIEQSGAPPAEERVQVRNEVPVPPPPVSAPPAVPSFFTPPILTGHPWLFLDLWRELRAMVRMFFDVTYHVAWSTRLTVLVLVPLILTSGWWFPLAYFPVLGTLFDKTLDLVLAFFAYKALSREARRYLDYKASRASSRF